jgi:hypothetical protein
MIVPRLSITGSHGSVKEQDQRCALDRQSAPHERLFFLNAYGCLTRRLSGGSAADRPLQTDC